MVVCQSEGTHQIVMSFLPPVVGCLPNKSSQRGGGGEGHRHPRIPPGYAPGLIQKTKLQNSEQKSNFFSQSMGSFTCYICLT